MVYDLIRRQAFLIGEGLYKLFSVDMKKKEYNNINTSISPQNR